jgi:2,3-bisphosphoglycerate-independent phosphoglycerate mutase
LMLPIIRDGLTDFGDYRILIMPDHATPVRIKSHTNTPVPAIIAGTGVSADSNNLYSEFINPTFEFTDGYKIAEFFFKKDRICCS